MSLPLLLAYGGFPQDGGHTIDEVLRYLSRGITGEQILEFTRMKWVGESA